MTKGLPQVSSPHSLEGRRGALGLLYRLALHGRSGQIGSLEAPGDEHSSARGLLAEFVKQWLNPHSVAP